jgi:hypothetical protein
LGEKQKKKREDESKKIEERFSSALSKTACTQRRVAAGEIQEAQKESFKTDIFKFFLVFLFCFYSGTAKDCNAMWEERKKEASERAGAPEREREREREEQRETAAATVAAAAELCNLWRWRQRGSAVGLKDRAVCVIRPGYLSYTYGGATNGHTHTWEGAYII